MISPLLIISLMFAVGGLVTLVMGRRLSRQAPLAWLIQVVGGLVLLSGILGILIDVL
ncbi:MAG: hypothetical protein ACOY93_13335 [Bacillota bacterium]